MARPPLLPTKPASLPQLLRTHGFSEALFYETVAELHAAGRLPGTVQGKATYTPSLHHHAQQAPEREASAM